MKEKIKKFIEKELLDDSAYKLSRGFLDDREWKDLKYSLDNIKKESERDIIQQEMDVLLMFTLGKLRRKLDKVIRESN